MLADSASLYDPVDRPRVFGIPEMKNPDLRPYRINMHHIGGRGGAFPFPLNPRFADGVETYIYDADEDCLEQMKTNDGGADHVVGMAVAGTDGSARLHVNYDPYTSSLRAANPGCQDFFYEEETCDYVLEDVLKPAKIVEMPALSLSSLVRRKGFQLDYLSLDVQGAEYDLLGGASEETLNDTVAIMCEFSFFQFYEGQKLFEDLVALLRGKGFFVAQLFPHRHEWSSFRTGIGWRGTGFLAHGDALFLRRDSHIVERAGNPFLALAKLAFISLSRGNLAYALQCQIGRAHV